MSIEVSITKRFRKRLSRSGRTTIQLRYVVNYRDPLTRRRAQLFFERHADAVSKRNELIRVLPEPTTLPDRKRADFTVGHAVEFWLNNRQTEVKRGTWRHYRQVAGYINGPLLVGTKEERQAVARGRPLARDVTYLDMLGDTLVTGLTTASIRHWHQTLSAQVGAHTANVARKVLRAALALAAEEFQLLTPAMPSRLGRGKSKNKKTVLTLQQITQLMQAALDDQKAGIYYAFPFLTGLRSSEQLALLWSDVDLDRRLIVVRRMQEQDGSTTSYTKTIAGMRDVPICPLLEDMLRRWKSRCPMSDGENSRVFPRLGGRANFTAGGRWGSGGFLSYANFRARYWQPVFARLGFPYVTPHSARHSFISTLQSQGIEIALVAKLAGHASAAVTLGHYTHAVRGGDVAVQALQNAWMPPAERPPGPANHAD